MEIIAGIVWMLFFLFILFLILDFIDIVLIKNKSISEFNREIGKRYDE